MTKPFATIGFSMLTALVVSLYLPMQLIVVAGALCLICLFLLLFVKRRQAVKKYLTLSAAFCFASLAFFLCYAGLQIAVTPYRALDGLNMYIRAQLLDNPEKQNGKFYYPVKVVQMWTEGGAPENKCFSLRLSSSKPIAAKPYDMIETEAVFYRFPEKYGFSSASSRLAKGFPIGAYMSGYACTVRRIEKKPFRYLPKWIQAKLAEQINTALPEDVAGLTTAMFLGVRNKIPETIDANFRDSGVSHLIVVSGMHMAIVAGVTLKFLSALKLKRRVRNIISIIVVFFFMQISGMGISAVRSGIMFIIFLLGDTLGRKTDPLNSLGFAVFLLCLTNPFLGGDAGFILSVAATLGILLFTQTFTQAMCNPFLQKGSLGKAVQPIFKMLSPGLAAMILVLPVQLYLFGSITLLSPLITLILAIPSTTLLYCAAAGSLLSCIPFFSPVANLFYFITGISAKLMIGFTNFTSNIALSTISIDGNSRVFVLAAVLLFLSACFFIGQRRHMFLSVIFLSLSLLCVTSLSQFLANQGVITVAISNAGESVSAGIIQGKQAIICAFSGDEFVKTETLLKRNRISVVSSLVYKDASPETDRTLLAILKNTTLKKVYYPSGLYLDHRIRSALTDVPKEIIKDKQEFLFDSGIKVSTDKQLNMLLSLPNGQRIAIEQASGGNGGKCDLLITNQLNTPWQSKLTVLQTSDQPKKLYKSGKYIFAMEHDITYIDIFPNAEMRIRREI